MHFEPKWAATCIGSMPDLNVYEICDRILTLFPDIPFWPQLVKKGPQENMIIQATEGLPCLELNLKERKVSYKREADRHHAFAVFYENYLSENVEHFAISEGYATGFYSLLRRIADNPSLSCKYIKGQVAGPITFGGIVEGSDGKPALYDPEIMDIIKKGLAMKIVWQAKKIRELGRTPIVFVDEPYLSGYGSAFVPIQRETVISTLNETIEEVKIREETLIGIHCCGNTDWPMILKTKLDIVSLDAYEFADYFVIYPEEIKDFLKRGGVVAWGIVPTANFTGKETVSGLLENLNKVIQALVESSIEREIIIKNSLLTPSCGMGLMSVEDSTKALKLLAELSSIASRKT